MSELVDIARLLAKTDRFINTMHVVREPFSLIPEKEHIGTCISYSDLLELRDEFVVELAKSIIPFVYSDERRKQILDELMEEEDSESGAWYTFASPEPKEVPPILRAGPVLRAPALQLAPTLLPCSSATPEDADHDERGG